MDIPAWLDQEAYPFRHRTAQLSRGAMHYVDEGEGPTLLFVHGTPTWSFEYRHLIAGLRGRFRCVAPDHLGFGLSERPPGLTYSPEEHAQNLREFVDKLGLREFTLVVHDFGGPIALPLVLQEPGRVNRLVVLNSWMWPFDDDPVMQKNARMASGKLGRFLYRYLNASLKLITPSAYGDRKKLTKAIHRQYLSVFPDPDSRERVLWALARALLGSSGHYAHLWEQRDTLRRVPMLVVWGCKDSAFPPRMLQKWREAAPHAQAVELAAAGHWPHEEEPQRVLEALTTFLEQTDRTAGAGATVQQSAETRPQA